MLSPCRKTGSLTGSNFHPQPLPADSSPPRSSRFLRWNASPLQRLIPSLTGLSGGVYQDSMRSVCALVCLIVYLSGPLLWAEDLPLTHNVPIPDFQNRTESAKPYDFDAPPEGMFRHIVLAEGFDEELGFQRTHEIVPVKPTDRFSAGVRPIFIVFELHQHYQSFQVFGRCYPEDVAGMDGTLVVAEDAMYIALEDQTGYLKLLPTDSGWKPGRYKVEIHAGEQINDMSLMGTMRFTITAASEPDIPARR